MPGDPDPFMKTHGMIRPTLLGLRWTFALASGALFFNLQTDCRADALYNFALNTTAINGLNGTLAFDLFNGDALFSNNSITISNFGTDGLLANMSNVVLTDAVFFNETLRPITFGNSLNFSLRLTTNFAGPGAPDGFSFFLLNSAGLLPLFPTSDPSGADALFAIDIDGSPNGKTTVFSSVTPATLVVPDQASTFSLLLVSIAILGTWKLAVESSSPVFHLTKVETD